MTLHAAYDAGTDFVTGLFDSDFHDSIPTPNIELTEGEYDAALALQAGGAILKRSGTAVIDGIVAPTLADYKTAKTAQLNAEANREMRPLLALPAEQVFIALATAREADNAIHSSDGAMTQANYPLLAAAVEADGDSIDHTNLAAKRDAVRTATTANAAAVAEIEKIRLEVAADIAAAGDIAAVDTAYAAIAWPV